MEIGNNIKVKFGATEWMKQHEFWIGSLPETIDGLDGKIIKDYTCFDGNDKHFEVKLNNIEFSLGIHPQWLQNNSCENCDNPYDWSKNDVVDNIIHIKCGSCGNEFTREYHGRCQNKGCNFYLDKDGFCELCEEWTMNFDIVIIFIDHSVQKLNYDGDNIHEGIKHSLDIADKKETGKIVETIMIEFNEQGLPV